MKKCRPVALFFVSLIVVALAGGCGSSASKEGQTTQTGDYATAPGGGHGAAPAGGTPSNK